MNKYEYAIDYLKKGLDSNPLDELADQAKETIKACICRLIKLNKAAEGS